MNKRRPGRWLAVPEALPTRLLDVPGIGPEHLGLLLLSWAESSRDLLDGRVAKTRVRRWTGWTKPRQNALVLAGAWIDHGDTIEVSAYLDWNFTREQVEAKSAVAADRGSAGGQAAADAERPRNEQGQFATPPGSESGPLNPALSPAQPGQIEPRKRQDVKSPSDADRDDLRAFYEVRGKAPTDKQRRSLDEVLDRHDVTGATWAADIIRANPDNPMGALFAADSAWKAGRDAEARAVEGNKSRRGWRTTQRDLAYYRGRITEDQRNEMNLRDAPLSELPIEEQAVVGAA